MLWSFLAAAAPVAAGVGPTQFRPLLFSVFCTSGRCKLFEDRVEAFGVFDFPCSTGTVLGTWLTNWGAERGFCSGLTPQAFLEMPAKNQN